MPRGFTKEGYPWIGAETPQFEIMEFADYQCFQCKKMHFFLRRLLAEYPTKIRLIHRHFPMEETINPLVKEKFHVGSGAMALLAAYAQFEGKFWETNDLLYSLVGQKDEINLKELSETIGLNYEAFSYAINDSNLRYKVKHDIASGIKMGINGTPAFVIDGEVYQGQIPAMIIKKSLK
jgi:protein-disulfide isomerase